MKTHKQLYRQITAFDNLYLAAKKAQKGKRFQNAVGQFNCNLEKELEQLQQELISQTYQPGSYRTFQIKDPKPRMISAAPYRDRVIHHALCNVITPILEKSMIFDTYANRKGKGSHKAINRYQTFCRKNTYVLKCDIRKFFPSIDHIILKKLLRKKIGCRATLSLIDLIIDNSNPQEKHDLFFPGDDLFTPTQRKKGLPIGNLTSQWFGNYYLNPLDHFIKEVLKCRYYIRYVDDFVLLDNDKSRLWDAKGQIEHFLEQYRLIIHPKKSSIHQTAEGVCFLGHRVFNDFKLVNKANVRRFRKRTNKRLKLLFSGKMTVQTFNAGIRSYFGHLSFSDTGFLRKKIYTDLYG